MCLSPCPIAIRSYGADSTVDRHDFAQLVLPLTGELAMDIAGREARLDRHVAAFVETGARHDQVSRVANRSIILDLHSGALDDDAMARLARRPYIALSPDGGMSWHLSQFLTLEPGDLVLTGTPQGVALSGRFPYLKPGDVVDIEIEGLGAQRQEFVAWEASR